MARDAAVAGAGDADAHKAPAHKIGFVGLGLMGEPMAVNLAESGFDVVGWNRTRLDPGRLENLSITVSNDVSSVVGWAEVVITMLSDGDAVHAVLFDSKLADAMRPGSTLIDMSSTSPSMAIDAARRLSDLGVGWLDAPVSGGTQGASNGNLAIMVGGQPEVFDDNQDVFSPLGQAHYIGPPGAGQMAKLANQMIVAATIGGVAEAMTYCKACGIDQEVVRHALTGGFADSRVLREHGRRMVDRDFEPGGAVSLQLKDMLTALESAGEHELELPLTELLASLYASLADSGSGDLDHSALLLEIERRNGASA